MADTTGIVAAEAQALLNDAAATRFTNAKLFPYTKKAYRELQRKLMLAGSPNVKEITAVIDVAANATDLGAGQPADLLIPISMEERPDGSSGLFTPMVEREWEPNENRTNTLRYWTWREELIVFLGATAAVEVKLLYRKGLPALANDTTSNILISDAVTFLAARCAALAAMYIGGDTARAVALQEDANVALEEMIDLIMQKNQSLPARRRPFRVGRISRITARGGS
jgi:hypothetical protein